MDGSAMPEREVREYSPRLFRSAGAQVVAIMSPPFVVVPLVTGTSIVTWSAVGSMIGVLIGGRFARRARLRLSPQGVEAQRVFVPWAAIDRIERRRHGFLIEDALVLKEPVTFSKWVTFEKREVIPLSTYDRDWQRGPIGGDIERWAPHLLPARHAP